MKETNNYPQGRSGSGTKKIAGPIKPGGGNPTKDGAIVGKH